MNECHEKKKVLRRLWWSLSCLMQATHLIRFRVWTADLMTEELLYCLPNTVSTYVDMVCWYDTISTSVDMVLRYTCYLYCIMAWRFFIWVSVHHKSIIYNKPTRCNSGSIVFINNWRCMFYIWVSVHHKSIIYNKPARCNSGSIVFINNYKYVLHVSDALCVHHQEHYKH